MTCEEALHNLVTYLDNELELAERDRLDEHLKVCRACFSRLEFEKRLKDRLTETKRAKPTAQLEARVRALLRRY
ncbi:MAG: zf-HC2 domain-containing protein [Rhodocyclales bacterium]|nr:zf-HC2 domain-containing protein [Rhodocyclales bacterium]